MAKITRNNQKIFGDNAATNNFFQFGNPDTTTKDVATMQAGNWLNGWSDGGVNINNVITPHFQEFNTLSYVTTTQIAYLQQEGIAEWHTETEYHQNSIVKESGTTNLYVSLTNNNTGNAVNTGGDNAFWKFAGDLSTFATLATPVGSIIAYSAQAVPANYLECDGSTLNTTQYADLFNVIAYTYGGSGTSFNIPDLRGEFIRGWDNGRGIDSGRAFGSLQLDQLQGHKHSKQIDTQVDSNAGGDGGAGNWNSGQNQDKTFTSQDNLNFITNQVTVTDGVNGTPREGSETRPRNVALKYIIRF